MKAMQTRMQELPKPAVAGGLALLGVAAWQLGVEFERAWLRSCDGPLIGETLAGEDAGASLEFAQETARAPSAERGRRRWVAGRQPRLAPRVRLS
jgi:hypothetical protein